MIIAFRRVKQEDQHKFEASLSYPVDPKTPRGIVRLLFSKTSALSSISKNAIFACGSQLLTEKAFQD